VGCSRSPRQATATTAKGFLDTLLARSPFSVRAIQVDGGSEFEAAFEEACQERSIRLFVLPPHSPKLNGHVERAHRTHAEEFYEVYDGGLDISSVNQALRKWETVYNTVRPHHALDGLTPAEHLRHYHPESTPKLPHMSWTPHNRALTIVYPETILKLQRNSIGTPSYFEVKTPIGLMKLNLMVTQWGRMSCGTQPSSPIITQPELSSTAETAYQF